MTLSAQDRRRTPFVPLLLMAGGVLVAAPLPRRGVGQTGSESRTERGRHRDFAAEPHGPAEDDRELLRQFEGLRVADVSDGMDAIGLQDVGLMDPKIGPLWRDLDTFYHRF